jgi:hypothetical protein
MKNVKLHLLIGHRNGDTSVTKHVEIKADTDSEDSSSDLDEWHIE